ncbi:MAG TPA: hypothetical protein VLB67_04995 [Acidimicrobiia bacterium]|nr:hypothetical protein [Acidimicrobiia bacterium]
MAFLVAFLLFFQVGDALTEPSVIVRESRETTMVIDLSVSGPAGDSVVAHLVEPGGNQQIVSLEERSFGRFGGVAEVPKLDLIVVFESLDGRTQSDPVRLTDIGLDRAVLGMSPVAPTTAPGPSSRTIGWGWLALGTGAAALAALAFWALPDRDEEDDPEAAAD